jgi:hypothetical protein
MENSIWVGKNCKGDVIASFVKPEFTEDGLFTHNGRNLYANCHVSSCFALDLKPLEIVELIYDTETGKVEVKQEREIGWYLVECKEIEDDGLIFAAHWDGKNWNPVRNKAKWRLGVTWKGLDENEVTVISGKLPDNEYLKGLE